MRAYLLCYNLEEAGEIRLDELSGLPGYNDACQSSSQREYDELADEGKGTSFWNGKASEKLGAGRLGRIKESFAERYPGMPSALAEPPCP